MIEGMSNELEVGGVDDVDECVLVFDNPIPILLFPLAIVEAFLLAVVELEFELGGRWDWFASDDGCLEEDAVEDAVEAVGVENKGWLSFIEADEVKGEVLG